MSRFNWSAVGLAVIACIACWFSEGWQCAAFGFLAIGCAIETWK